MSESNTRIEPVSGSFRDRFTISVGGEKVAEIARKHLMDAAEVELARAASGVIQQQGQVALCVYEKRQDGASSDDAITLEIGANALRLNADEAKALACVLIAYARSDTRRQWLVRAEYEKHAGEGA